MHLDNLSRIIKNFKKCRILVIGDIMLDEYVWGAVNRISPEAPVPIVAVKKINYVPGGAANVAANISSLKGKVNLIGIAGNDETKDILVNELDKRNINTKHLVIANNRLTTKKSRIMAEKQQFLRVDWEKRQDISLDDSQKISEIISKQISKVDALIISDYDKGTITKDLADKILSLANRYKKTILIDTKPEHRNYYQKFTLITPNEKEAREMSGLKDENISITKVGQKLVNYFNSSVLITQGSRGMTLFEQNGVITHFPTEAREVFDVSGAGDTVVAVLALGLASKISLRQAIILANHAAGIEVAKMGTATVTPQELMNKFEREESKVKSLNETRDILNNFREKGKKIVFTNGCFDILHIGHAKYLQEARNMGDILVLGLNTDKSIKRLKGPQRPIIKQKERAEMLASLGCVDYIVFFEESDPSKIIGQLKPDIHVKGGDYKIEEMPETKVVRSYGGEVRLVPMVDGPSTSKIIKKILEVYK